MHIIGWVVAALFGVATVTASMLGALVWAGRSLLRTLGKLDEQYGGMNDIDF
jgi:hypothetical protein